MCSNMYFVSLFGSGSGRGRGQRGPDHIVLIPIASSLADLPLFPRPLQQNLLQPESALMGA